MSLACQAVYKAKSVNQPTLWSKLSISSLTAPTFFSYLLTLKSPAATNLKPYGTDLSASLVSLIKPNPTTRLSQVKPTLAKLHREFGQDLSLSIGLIDLNLPDQLIVGLLGNLTVGLIRANSFVPLIDSVSPDKPVVITGPAKPDDLVILGRPEFVKTIASAFTQALAQHTLTPSELSDLALRVVSNRTQPGLVISLIPASQPAVPAADPTPPQAHVFPPPQVVSKPVRLPRPRLNLTGLKISLFKLLGRFRPRLSHPAPTVSLRSPAETASRSQRQKKRVLLLIIGCLTIFLIYSLNRSYHLSQNSNKQLTDQSLTQIDALLSEADSLVTLNPKRARQLYNQANELIRILPTSSSQLSASGGTDTNSSSIDHTNRITAKLAELEAKLDRKYFLPPESPAFADISLLKPDTSIDSLTREADSLIVYSQATGSVFTIAEDNGRVDLVASDPRLAQATETTPLSGHLYLLKSNSVAGVDLADGQARVAIKLVSGQAISSYGSNLYIYLASGQIDKYIATGLTFSDSIGYLQDPLDPPPSVADMAIDGPVWLLTRKAEVLKFIRGNPDTFSLEDINQPLLEPTRLYTSKTNANLYILEPAAARVVIYNKTGSYVSQLLWAPSIDATGLAVSADDTQLYLSVGSRLYKFPLADYLRLPAPAE